MKRQTIRKTLIFISFLLFPVTMWYFSPYLIIQALSQHILNGSFWVFLAMLELSMFCGRAWCGYLCPAGGLQECCSMINNKPAKQGRRDKIKFVIWVIWIILIITTFILGKNDVTIQFFYMTEHGISIAQIYNYVIYYVVIMILVFPALFHGKRGACHYLCWMAPFMIIGETIGRVLHLPQLHIEADESKCISCKKCSSACPMGLEVHTMVKCHKNSTCTECIQCGACVDACPKGVLSYRLFWKKRD